MDNPTTAAYRLQSARPRYASALADSVLGVAFPIPGIENGAVALMDYHGGDAAIVDGARTSFGASAADYDDAKLIDHLVRNRHTSPLEQAGCTFQAAIPIFVCRQLVRHRTLKFNEFSMRYAPARPRFHFPAKDDWLGVNLHGNRQGRGETLETGDYERHMKLLREAYETAQRAYDTFLRDGVANELARLPLPVGQFTLVRFAVDIHNLQRLLEDVHAQREFRSFATVLAALAYKVAPAAMRSWQHHRIAYAGGQLKAGDLAVPHLTTLDSLPNNRAEELMGLRAEK